MKKIKKLLFDTPAQYYEESMRYYKNAKDTLRQVKIAYDTYQDLKPVREAASTCYLSMLLALDGYFLARDVDRQKLPTSIDGYGSYLKKYIIHNGKLTHAFLNAYNILHIFVYYKGTGDIRIVKEGFEKAKEVIETISSRKLQ